MKKGKSKAQQWFEAPISKSDKFYSTQYPGKDFQCCGLDGNEIISEADFTKSKRIRFDCNDTRLYKKIEDFAGVNPVRYSPIEIMAYQLESIMYEAGYSLRRNEFKKDDPGFEFINWNPYFIINGKKEYYQRGYVWTLEQKQALIETIYLGLDCGRIILHEHSVEEQIKNVKETGIGYRYDIVDGKQRLSTILEFVTDKFPDAEGNYYSELSYGAHSHFMNYKGLIFGKMNYKSTPQQIADAFLNNAVAGTPLSKEHIEYMKSVKDRV